MEEHLDEVTGLSGIEVLNGSTHREACMKAAEYAKKLDLIPVGASDCHVPEKVGVCATYFPMEIQSETDLVRAFSQRRYEARFIIKMEPIILWRLTIWMHFPRRSGFLLGKIKKEDKFATLTIRRVSIIISLIYQIL